MPAKVPMGGSFPASPAKPYRSRYKPPEASNPNGVHQIMVCSHPGGPWGNERLVVNEADAMHLTFTVIGPNGHHHGRMKMSREDADQLRDWLESWVEQD